MILCHPITKWIAGCILLLSVTVVSSAQSDKTTPRLDANGFPLPKHALYRLGSLRLRHAHPIAAVAFTSGGDEVVSVGVYGDTHIWDAKSARNILCAKGDKQRHEFVKLSPDGKLFAVGTGKQFELRHVKTGKVLHSLKAPDDINGVAFSPDGEYFATALKNRSIWLWQISTAIKMYRFSHDDAKFQAPHSYVSICPKRQFLAFADATGLIYVWDIEKGCQIHKLKVAEEGDDIVALRFSPDGRFLASTHGSFKGKVVIWDVLTGKSKHQIDLPDGSIKVICFSPDGRFLAFDDRDGKTVLWDFRARKTRTISASASALAFSADGKRLLLADNHMLRLWNVTSGRDVFPPKGHKGPVSFVAFLSDGQTLVSGTQQTWWGGDNFLIWNSKDRRKHQQWSLQPGQEWSFQLHREKEWGVVHSRHIQVLHLRSGKTLFQHKIPKGFETAGFQTTALSEDASTLAVFLTPIADDPRNNGKKNKPHILLWNLRDGTKKRLETVSIKDPDWISLFFSPDGNSLVLCQNTKKGPFVSFESKPSATECWDAKTGKKKWFIRWEGLHYPYLSPEIFTYDHKYLHITLQKPFDSYTYLIDMQSGQKLAGSQAPMTLNLWLASANHHLLYLSSAGLCETFTGQTIRALKLPSGELTVAKFSPDDKMIAVGTTAGEIFLFDTITGKQLGRLSRHRGRIASLAFSPDGRRLASGSDDTTILVWDIAPCWQRRPRADKTWPQTKLSSMWKQLAAPKAKDAYQAVAEFVQSPKQTVAFFRKALPPAKPVDPVAFRRTIAHLDSRRFAIRQKATQKLLAWGAQVEPKLHKLRKTNLTLEVHLRLDRILNDMRTLRFTPQRLQKLRALQALEWIGTAEAKTLVQSLAKGIPDNWLTQEARRSLQNWQERE